MAYAISLNKAIMFLFQFVCLTVCRYKHYVNICNICQRRLNVEKLERIDINGVTGSGSSIFGEEN